VAQVADGGRRPRGAGSRLTARIRRLQRIAHDETRRLKRDAGVCAVSLVLNVHGDECRSSPRHVRRPGRRAGQPGCGDRRRRALHEPSAGDVSCAGRIDNRQRSFRRLRRSASWREQTRRVVGSRRARAALRAGCAGARHGGLADRAHAEHPEGGRDHYRAHWGCEVISTGTARLDRTRKLPVCAREGVRHLGLVAPIARTLEVYRLENRRWAVAGTYSGDESLRAESVEAIALDMSRWWMPA
jgi:hypothetical protein